MPDDVQPKRRRTRAWLQPVILISVVLGAILIVRASPLQQYLTYEHFQELITSAGDLAPLFFLAVYAVGPVLMAPGTLLTVAGAAVFGLGWGFVYCTIGANIGSFLAFMVGRLLGRGFVQSRLKDAKEDGLLLKLDRSMEKNGLFAILFLRLLLAPYNVLNYAASLTRVRTRDYVIGTFFGMLPVTFGIVFLGDTITQAWAQGDFSLLLTWKTAVALAIFGVCLLIPFMVRRRGAVKEPAAQTEASSEA